MKPENIPWRKCHFVWRGLGLTNRLSTGHTGIPSIEGNGRFIPESKAIDLWEGVRLLLKFDAEYHLQGPTEKQNVDIDEIIALLNKGIE